MNGPLSRSARIVLSGLVVASCGTPPGSDPSLPQEFVNSVGMEFRLIPCGAFQMGSMSGQEDEQPTHQVTLSPFYMAVHEVTQEQYETLVGENPSGFRGPTLPVESVDWFEASAFCARLSEKEGALYRLPTEAEWEYAARGGVEGAEFTWGKSAIPLVEGVPQANIADASFQSAFPEAAEEGGSVPEYDDLFSTTSPAGSFPPNGFGLFDMIGNVFEWCSDYYVLGTQYYWESPGLNPTGPSTGDDRVLRGASWWAAPERYYRVASRFRDSPHFKAAGIGFRCVIGVEKRGP